MDGDSYGEMNRAGISAEAELEDNNAYHALGAVNGLIFTGPTGTNINDVALALVRPRKTAKSKNI